MAWFQQLSDNQAAIFVCIGGLLSAWGLLSVSYAFRSDNRDSMNSRQKSENRTEPVSGSQQAA